MPAARASVVAIVDGDTIRIDGQSVRIIGIDAPETWKPHCEAEYVAGLAAKERLRAILDDGPVTFQPTGMDRYQRTLAQVFVGKMNVGEALVSEGFALRYQQGSKAKLARIRTWCGADADFEDRW